MKVSPLVLAATVVSPAMGFSMLQRYNFPRFGSMLKELDEVFEADWPATFFEKSLERMDKEMQETGMTFRRASPRYEVLEDPTKFEVKLEIPEYKLDEIDIDLKSGGRVLSIKGAHEVKEEGRKMSSKFQQSFSIDPSVEIDKIKANFHDGELVISAPRHPQLPADRKIEVTNHMLEEKKEVPVVEEPKDEEPKAEKAALNP